MTTSTTDSKKIKKVGPIRTGAVLAVSVFCASVAIYFVVFFDGHLRLALQMIGTSVNGAEVNVGHVSTSFTSASIEIGEIQITDKNKPERNIFSVGVIRFKMLWDALLRAKIVIDEASILDIQALTPRKKPGFVVPPEPPSDKPSLVKKVQDQVLEQTKKQYSENFLGDVVSVLGGTDPKEQLKNLESQLKSDARIKELQKELSEKKLKWEARIKELPQGKELEAYGQRVKALKFDFNNPAELAQSVKEADKIIKEANEKVKLIEQSSKELKSDTDTYSKAFKDLEKMVQEDIRDLQNKLKIPSLDAKEFSQQLFMSMIEAKLAGYAKYIQMARHYMPPKKTEAQKKADKEEQILPEARGKGRTYRFPVTTGYPLFWLKKAAIQSELSSGEYSGAIKGEIRDLISDPSYLKKPTLLLVQGEFPKQKISGLDMKVTFDHTTEVAKESMNLKIASFPTGAYSLSKSPEVTLGIQEAVGSTNVSASLVNQEIKMEMSNTFSGVNYDLAAKNKVVFEIIDGVLKGIPKVTLDADITGSFSDLSIHIRSNLGDELSRGFQKQIQAKVDEAKAKLKKMIDEKIGANRDKLKAEMDKLTGDLTKSVDGKKTEADKVVKEAQEKLTSGQQGAPVKRLEEEGKKLLKKFKF